MNQSQQEIVNITDATESPSQRIWEVDFLRGFLLLFVMLDHLMFNLWYFCYQSHTTLFQWLYKVSLTYYDAQTTLGMLQETFHNGFVMAFVFISGVSSNFSRNSLNRALKMATVALLISAVTSALSQVIYRPLEINFNVIHVLAVCCFAYCGIEKLYNKAGANRSKVVSIILIVVAVLLGVVGYYFHVNPIENGGVLVVLVNCANSVTFSPADYLPLLPALSFFVVGALVGKKLYVEKRSLLGEQPRFAKLLCWSGQKSLFVYVLTQVVMFGFFYLFAHLLKIL